MKFKSKLAILGLIPIALMTGCADDEHNHGAMYQIKVTNLTSHQPLTPPAAILHNGSYVAWELGGTASMGLEKLAEGGDTTDFIDTAKMSTSVLSTGTLSTAPFGPGETAMATLEVSEAHMVKLTLATMLANTNDAFAGINNVDVGSLMEGQSMTFMAMAMDAGTEANTESAGTIPGPVDGGTGYSATRDDKDFIAVHAGVVTMDDGLATSVLDESHRWMGPVAKVEVMRMH